MLGVFGDYGISGDVGLLSGIAVALRQPTVAKVRAALKRLPKDVLYSPAEKFGVLDVSHTFLDRTKVSEWVQGATGKIPVPSADDVEVAGGGIPYSKMSAAARQVMKQDLGVSDSELSEGKSKRKGTMTVSKVELGTGKVISTEERETVWVRLMKSKRIFTGF